MEEGELTESGFEDIYEPSLEPGEAHKPTRALAQQPSTDDDEDYDPANPGSPTQLDAVCQTWPDRIASTESTEDGKYPIVLFQSWIWKLTISPF